MVDCHFRDIFSANLTLVKWAECKIWHMDFCTSLIGLLLFVLVWREVTYDRAMKGTIPQWAQYYSLMYAGFAVLLLLNFAYTGIILHQTNFLDNETIRENQLPFSDNLTLFTEWQAEADLDGTPLLRYFSLSLPVWLLLTFVTCLIHTLKFVRELRAKNITKHGFASRERTIVILALPFVYGFMAFWSVEHTWQITASSMGIAGRRDGLGTISNTVDMLLVSYEGNFAVADAYEAVALWLFAKLTMGVLKRRGKAITSHVHKSESTRNLDQTLTKDVEDLVNFEIQLSDSTRRLTMGGIKWFCISCYVTAICEVFPMQMYYFGGEKTEDWFMSTYDAPPFSDKLSGFLSGMGTVASFAAIENLLVVEFEFGHSHLTSYNTAKKFWSTKVLVSLVFLQQILLMIPPMSHMTETRQKLAHASLLCFECFLISIGHLWAWDHTEGWYNDNGDEGDEPAGRDLNQPLLSLDATLLLLE